MAASAAAHVINTQPTAGVQQRTPPKWNPTGSERHSGLGITSFIIALLVGGLDVILALVIVLGIARPEKAQPQPAARVESYGSYANRAYASALASANQKETTRGDTLRRIAFLDCMSLPLCLVGIGLSVVAFIAHQNCNHLFTWIGLLGNGGVIVGVIGLYVLAPVLGG